MKKYWAIASLTFISSLGFATTMAPTQAQMVADGHGDASSQPSTIVELCNQLAEDDEAVETLTCLFEQSTHLNRAKNLARQRGEMENGGIIVSETEPSMHGPSAETPHQLVLEENNTQYIFTFRVRPRATANYTHESQVRVTYTYETATDDAGWTIDTVYNNRITLTPVSYAEQLEAEDG